MKLVDFETFIRMPAGTIFAPYEPCILKERLAVKTDEGRVFSYPSFVGNKLTSLDYSYGFNGVMPLEPWMGDIFPQFIGEQQIANFEIYDGDNNDYQDYEMFLVFEEEDIDRMINVLQWAKGGCVGECDCSD